MRMDLLCDLHLGSGISHVHLFLFLILYKELVENLNQILNGEYPTALKQQVLKFMMVLATVSVPIF